MHAVGSHHEARPLFGQSRPPAPPPPRVLPRPGARAHRLGTGNWSQAPHIDLRSLLESAERRNELLGAVAGHGLAVSALNCSGNPLHPGAEGEAHRKVIADSIALAAQLGVGRIVTMSGCPGGPGDNHANWIVTSWPPETREILAWQWREQVILLDGDGRGGA